MMKKLIYIILVVSGLCSYGQIGAAQESPPENRFKQSEQAAQNNADALPGAAQAGDSGGGDPGDPQPIDAPLPLLGIAALAIIFYTVYRRKNITE